MVDTDLSTVLSRRPLGLVFDIDGTLSPFARIPEDARLYPGVVEMLEYLRQHAHVAIMTGRALQDGARMVGVDDITYVGTHGLEWSDGLPETHEVRLVAGAQRYIEAGKRLLDLVEQHLDSLPGVIVQRKKVGGTLHYRVSETPEQTREQLLVLLEEPARREGMRLSEGKRIVEVLAPLAVDKGQALREYAHRFQVQGIIFAGDDRTDLDGVLEIGRLRTEGIAALAIVVKHQDTLPALLEHADIIVDGVEGMAHLMKKMVKDIR